MDDSTERVLDLQDRRSRERTVWWLALIASIALHLLIILLSPIWAIPFDLDAAAGPDNGDGRAAAGALQAVSMGSPPPSIPQPAVVSVPDIVLPEPEVILPEVPEEVEPAVPDVPEPGVGTGGTGDDPLDAATGGFPGGTGRGDGGQGADGIARLIPPSPRGMIIPPTNRDLRGTEIEVWVFVNEQGRVVADSTQLRPPTSDRRFNEQLTREAAQWVFNPARENGVAVAAWFPYVIGME
jgi:hypothetical protein